jgi:haloalkane dehalogenase
VRYARVHGLRMAYREIGTGDPVVFLHGNPTSSYLWREVLGRAARHGRCVAPDLVGMGASDELPGSGPGSYRFVEHRRHLDGLLDALAVTERVVLVGHDWGCSAHCADRTASGSCWRRTSSSRRCCPPAPCAR